MNTRVQYKVWWRDYREGYDPYAHSEWFARTFKTITEAYQFSQTKNSDEHQLERITVEIQRYLTDEEKKLLLGELPGDSK